VCEYDTDPDVSRTAALRRKNDALQLELGQLKQLFDYICNCPDAEAKEVFQQLRMADDPQDLVRLPRGQSFSLGQNCQSVRPVSIVEKLGISALTNSTIEVSARPWTSLASDGLVSELISAFFAYDHCSRIPFVDRECFLADMLSGDVGQARFCSPFLVNAICALRCVSSNMQDPGKSLTMRTVVYI
jgi:hypothetical protein